MKTLALLLFSAFPLFAGHLPYSLSPASGPKSGGTTVILSGHFGNQGHTVIFGGVPAGPVTLLDEHTLSAVAPPHFAETVEVAIFEQGQRLPASLTFTYRGDAPLEQFERLLLPIFLPPIPGAFGSEFRTYFRASSASLAVFGLRPDHAPLTIGPGTTSDFVPNGTPGRFLFVPKELSRTFDANLRVADTSRSAENFGTELPIVRESDFAEDFHVLHGVPTDPRFRNTLRVYAMQETTVTMEIEGVFTRLQLRKNDVNDPYEPAYAVFTNFPVGRGELKVTLIGESARGPSPPIYLAPFWAFVSVTNNDTQMITTITPQP